MSRILVIYSGHPFSTLDVCDNVCAGLRDLGETVIPYRLDRTLQMAEALLNAAIAQEVPDNLRPDVFNLAVAGIPGHALIERCDYAIAITGVYLPYTVPMALRQAGIPTALICTESPYETHDRERWIATAYDLIFTNERRAIPLFTESAPGTVHYLPHAFNPRVHHPWTPDADKQTDVAFIGTGFPERRDLFGGVDWTGINATILGTLWDGIDSMDALSKRLVANNETAAWYRSAAINVNHHRTSSFYGTDSHIADGAAESLGPRAYEIAACGGFQLMDDSRTERCDVFGDTMPTYRSGDSADLERQIRYYLARPDERDRLRTAQHQAVLGHTWTARARQILDILTTA